MVKLQPIQTTDVVLVILRCPLKNLRQPDFLVSTRYFQVESPNAKWGRLGESEEYFWETKTESTSAQPFIPTDDEIFDR